MAGFANIENTFKNEIWRGFFIPFKLILINSNDKIFLKEVDKAKKDSKELL
jgi:hypothetical protein